MSLELTLNELAEWTGESTERLGEWQTLGLLGECPGDRYTHEHVERARLVQLFLQRGARAEDVARSLREGALREFLPDYLDARFPGAGRPAYSLEEAAEKAGVSTHLGRRLWQAASVGRQRDLLSEEDLELLSASKTALSTGFPEEALLQLLRVWGDSLRRAAEATYRLFHFYGRFGPQHPEDAHRPLEASPAAAGVELRPLLEPAILYFLRKGLVLAQREDLALHVAEEAGLLEEAEVPGKLNAAVLFADLASFTSLAESMGDAKAAQVLGRFSSLVRQATSEWDGQLVKQIGDAFMVVFAEPHSAVACALEIEERATVEDQFLAVRCGIHWGPVLYRDGDYVGSTVNVAARVAAAAERHQLLVTTAVRDLLPALENTIVVPLGRRRLKGVAEDLDLFEIRRRTEAAARRAVDPVCGMEIDPEEAAARLSLGGVERVFCSEECLQRFVAAPERYGA
jgi:class 3 adenylate cyclase